MPLTEALIKKIRAERNVRFRKLGLPDDFIAPNYRGRSIVNVTASIAKVFDAPIETAPLDEAILDGLTEGVERIVFVIVDALGYQRLLDTLEMKPRNGWHTLLNGGGRIVPLTSVFPSTTTAALTTLWTGRTPFEHGFLGYQLFLRDYGVRADMIYFSPVATKSWGMHQLLDSGLEPEKFLATPSLPQVMPNVPVYHFIEQPYVESALSRTQIRGTRETIGCISSSDLWVSLRQCVERHREERALFSAYWSGLDSIGHKYGPTSETHLAEINNFAYSFEREFLRPLSSRARAHTLFLLTADHGQVDSPKHRAVFTYAHPDLRANLMMDFTGDARAAYLYCRHGRADAVRAYFDKNLREQFFLLDSREALDAGLFGEGIAAPETEHRVGDFIALARDDYYLWDRRDEPTMLGRHAGLAEGEMLVPLIAARLDG